MTHPPRRVSWEGFFWPKATLLGLTRKLCLSFLAILVAKALIQSDVSMRRSKKIFLFTCLLFWGACFASQTHAEQHPTIIALTKTSSNCLPNVYKPSSKLSAAENKLAQLDTFKIFLPNELGAEKNHEKHFSEIERLSAFALNQCAARGNWNYIKEENKSFFSDFKIKSVLNLDFLAHTRVDGKTLGYNYVFVPMNPSMYPKKESIISFLHALTSLSEASPTNRVFISCMKSNHRTGLISAAYQFLLEYGQSPKQACSWAGSLEDKGWIQAEKLADQGMLTYNMPKAYKDFYKDFCQAVCREKSQEFLEQLLK